MKKQADTKPPPFARFASRRSVVHSTHGMVASSQPLATEAGIRILKEGGNAADAAVAVAAVLGLTEPASTGVGGDLFCLYYNPKTHKIHSLNASGRSPNALTLELALSTIPPEEIKKNHNHIPATHALAVTVPGAAAGFCDTVSKFGSGNLTLAQILAPAIEYAEEGFPVHQISAEQWSDSVKLLKAASPNYGEVLKNGDRAPKEGEIMRVPTLAQTYRELAEKGRKGFYEGRVAEEIVKVVKDRGGVLSLEDLKRHGDTGSVEVEPISLEIPWGVQEGMGPKTVWQCAPNGQGIISLLALGVLEALENRGAIPKLGSSGGYEHNSVEYLHSIIFALRTAFADGRYFVHDPCFQNIPIKGLLSKDYMSSRSELFDTKCVGAPIEHGYPPEEAKSDTVYFSVADKDGGGCSFINSVCSLFGSGMIPKGCGFCLQDRGIAYLVSPKDHPNVIAPNKLPYQTIIPAMMTTPFDYSDSQVGEKRNAQDAKLRLDTVFGVMGAMMQPQGHVQVLLNMLAFGMTPQEALDAPRVCIGPDYADRTESGKMLVNLEAGIREDVLEALKEMGYTVRILDGKRRSVFGRGQVLRLKEVEVEEGCKVRVWSGGSDLRGDGCCIGY